MDNLKELCLKLAFAESEEEVTKIVEKYPILKGQKNWRHYGNVPNNIGTITGQSPQAVPSLIEKITNSIDAILIKACRLKGDNPESSSSPKTMEEALEKYFKLNDEIYSDYSESERRKLAQNIQIIADGSKTNPNIIIYDNGEGQYPQDFPKTLVSLNQGNKSKIFFVQGKYNMGGTAVLPFCGEKRYQLIISKKNLSEADRNTPFGFTLIRRNRGEGENVKSSWYEYSVNSDGSVMEFDSGPLDLGLFQIKFNGGTYIKLYNYDLRNRSNITLDLWRDLNRCLFKPALPFVVYEKREYKGHTPSKITHGNRMRALIDDREAMEKIFSMKIKSDNVEYPVEVYVIKKKLNKENLFKIWP